MREASRGTAASGHCCVSPSWLATYCAVLQPQRTLVCNLTRCIAARPQALRAELTVHREYTPVSAALTVGHTLQSIYIYVLRLRFVCDAVRLSRQRSSAARFGWQPAALRRVKAFVFLDRAAEVCRITHVQCVAVFCIVRCMLQNACCMLHSMLLLRSGGSLPCQGLQSSTRCVWPFTVRPTYTAHAQSPLVA